MSALFAPTFAQALSFRETMDSLTLLLYGAVGLFGGAAVLLLAIGYGIYLVRMGIEGRASGIRFMEWAVAVLFIVTILAVILWLIS